MEIIKMNLFKKLTNSLLNLFNTIVSILTFGFIKLNKSIRKEFNVELLKAQLSDFELKRKENYDKLVNEVQEAAVIEKKLQTLNNEKNNLLKQLDDAKNKDDKILFTKLATKLKVKNEIIKSREDALYTRKTTISDIEKTNDNLELEIEKTKGKIEIFEAKKENVEVRKESNNIKSTLYLPNGTDSSLNINEINEMYDDEIVRENAKSEFLEQFAPTISNESFTSIEEMEKFLEENK